MPRASLRTPPEKQALIDALNAGVKAALQAAEAQLPGTLAALRDWLDGSGPKPDLSMLTPEMQGFISMKVLERRRMDEIEAETGTRLR